MCNGGKIGILIEKGEPCLGGSMVECKTATIIVWVGNFRITVAASHGIHRRHDRSVVVELQIFVGTVDLMENSLLGCLQIYTPPSLPPSSFPHLREKLPENQWCSLRVTHHRP